MLISIKESCFNCLTIKYLYSYNLQADQCALVFKPVINLNL
jgi:hypothetical protein